jgi:hypothetical protein
MGFLNSSNPTKLRVGATGRLEGRTYAVLGRVVLSTADGYKWQEYNLRATTGEIATLVYESGDWKLFRLFEPAAPMTAAEAALARVDDTLTIGGRSVAVTYVGKSRVVYIEGAAPEGMKLGDRASYFNADRAVGGLMVVSWTGLEMEFYEGHELSEREVTRAFGLPRGNFLIRVADDFRNSTPDLGNVIGIGLVVILIFFRIVGELPDRDPVFIESAPKQAAAAARLPDHAKGSLWGHDYTVSGHVVVEIARPGKKFDRHEYLLTDAAGVTVLLVQGLEARPDQWHVLTRSSFPPTYTSVDAAQVKVGNATTAEGKRGEVVYLFTSRTRLAGEAVSGAPWPSETQYGFVARLPDEWLLARWTERELQLYRGQAIAARDVAEGFHLPVEALSRL